MTLSASVPIRRSVTGSWRAVRTAMGAFHVAVLDGAIVHTGLPSTPRAAFLLEVQHRFPEVPFKERQADPLLERAAQELSEWAQGDRTEFDLPLAPTGTAFQRLVWDALAGIPYGQVRSYAEIAQSIGKPGASRAVGQANHRNPVAPFIPCHRVITAMGTLGGYGGGLTLKRRMLELEGVHL